MPIIKSAKKKLRADNRKQIINKKVKDKVRIALKKFKVAPSTKTLDLAYSALDTAAKKNIIPKGRADRKKGRLALSLEKGKAVHRKKTASKKAVKAKAN
ncbi:MAG: hypothetical protein A2172_01125 [Candidatus Woykebacteria bacterium RBG_13_40_15]|uniref:Small ribosomal subunit protein bS20 n=1 Tax=Candidatus Woykebacteria bacterium RBG_13_40_15 TaxID=1802593 RepID=A0A1G1W8Y3_9BACT|nr:MAG: hypothetical protein A2172_01125 [Candidatus Woykebacteria bacterium RBG_13_40_15]